VSIEIVLEGSHLEHLLPPEFERAVRDFISSTDFLGYVACGLVLMTFCMQAMIPLRVVALVSNVAFISYGWAAQLIPILLLHILLAVINIASLHKSLFAAVPRKSERTSQSGNTSASSIPSE